MTEDQVKRAGDLIHARKEIAEFLSCRDRDSEIVKRMLNSSYNYEKESGEKLPNAVMCEISIRDASEAYEDDADTLVYFEFSRDVLERALKPELDRIDAELKALGVESAQLVLA